MTTKSTNPVLDMEIPLRSIQRAIEALTLVSNGLEGETCRNAVYGMAETLDGHHDTLSFLWEQALDEEQQRRGTTRPRLAEPSEERPQDGTAHRLVMDTEVSVRRLYEGIQALHLIADGMADDDPQEGAAVRCIANYLATAYEDVAEKLHAARDPIEEGGAA